MLFVIYRWIVAAFFAVSIAYSVVDNIKIGHFGVFFIYLTHLNLCGTLLTAFLGALLVTLHYFKKLKVDRESKLLRIYSSLWNQSTVLSILVSAFYWTVIYQGEPIDVNNVLVHMTNSIVLVIDLLIVAFPAKYSNVIGVIVAEIVYLGFTVVYQLLGGLDK